MVLEVVDLPVASFLAVNLHWLVEFLVELLGWNVQLGVYLGELK